MALFYVILLSFKKELRPVGLILGSLFGHNKGCRLPRKSAPLYVRWLSAYLESSSSLALTSSMS